MIESIRFFEECVAAGSPQWNDGLNGGRTLAASDMFGKHDWRKMFTTRVRGSSMTTDGIHDGDIVLVDPTVEARDGDIVVAYVEGQGQVVKRLTGPRRRNRLGVVQPRLRVDQHQVVVGVDHPGGGARPRRKDLTQVR